MSDSIPAPPHPHRHWIRFLVVALLAFFYVDGFLRGASPLETLVFAAISLPLVAGLLHTAENLPLPSAPTWHDVLATVLGACAVAFTAREWHLRPVLCAATVGLLAALPIMPARIKSRASPVYVGAFVGMSSPLVLANLGWVAAAAVIAGLLYSALRSTWLGVGGKLGFLAFSGVTIAVFAARIADATPGAAQPLALQPMDKIAILVVAPLAAVVTFELQQRFRWSPVLASAAVTCTFVLTMVTLGLESLFVVAPAGVACFGGSFVAMTGEVHAASRPWLPLGGGLLYALLQIAFQPTLAGIGGDFGATAVVAVLVVLGVEKLAVPLLAIARRRELEKSDVN